MNKNFSLQGNTFKKRNKFFYGTCVYLLVSIIIYILSRLSTGFADLVSKYPGGFVRFVLAGATSIIPFSLAEAFLLLLVPVSLIFIFLIPDKPEGKHMTRNSYIMLGVLLLVASMYLSVFAPCYFKTSVEEKMSLDSQSVAVEDLQKVIVKISEEIEHLEKDITQKSTGETLMPHSYSDLVSKLNNAYDSFCEKYDFIGDFYSYPKPLSISKLMPYTRISGFYTFFSGEANISTAYPDFTIPFTMAHEMAHQRGIAKEDEANFIAFLVCTESNDSYIKYSGYAELLNYLLDDLYNTDPALYSEILSSIPSVYKKEYKAYVKFATGTYSKGASTVATTVNNTMLQSQGQSEGTKSYNLVTKLATAYYNKIWSEQN